ncbi:MAG: hypothetical protein WKF57_06370 [Nakamurella sp.]
MAWRTEGAGTPARPAKLIAGPIHTGKTMILGSRTVDGSEHFYVERNSRLRKDTKVFPATDEGWKSAWSTFADQDPAGSAVYLRMEEQERQRDRQRESNKQLALAARQARLEADRSGQREPHLTSIADCYVVSSYGETAMRNGAICSLEFLATKMTIRAHGAGAAFVQIAYADILNLYVDGPGARTTGGGFIGGGFGIKDAVEGMLIASFLNKLTTQTTVLSFIEVQDAERHFVWQNVRQTPAQLDLQLKPVLAKIRAIQATSVRNAVPTPPPAAPLAPAEIAASPITDQLTQLAQLHTAGALTDDE